MITLEHIKAEQDKLSIMIATLEARSKIAAAYPVTIEFPQLEDGELYLGAIIKPNGQRQQTILLPGDNEASNWQAQIDWADSICGDLPDMVELAMFRALMPEQFKPAAYWSNQTHVSDASYAWYQHFYDGFQLIIPKSVALRARAVRRLISNSVI